eukprot:4309325-Pyramimonas_sp.AAC.1
MGRKSEKGDDDKGDEEGEWDGRGGGGGEMLMMMRSDVEGGEGPQVLQSDEPGNSKHPALRIPPAL